MEYNAKNNSQGYGIAALILGLIAIPMAIIPCTFIPALLLGVTGVLLAIIGLSVTAKQNSSKSLVVAGLIFSALSVSIASMWSFAFGKNFGILNEITNEIRKEIKKEFGDNWEGKFHRYEDAFDKAFDELEDEDLDWDDWGNKISDEEFNMMIAEFRSILTEYVTLVNSEWLTEEEIIAQASKNAIKSFAVIKNIQKVDKHLTQEQKEKFQEIITEYQRALNSVNP